MADSFSSAQSLVQSVPGLVARCAAPLMISWLLLAPVHLLPFLPEPAHAFSPKPAPKQTAPAASAPTGGETGPGATPDAVWPDGPPFVASTPEIIERMLGIAGVKSGDLVYDIGSGDGLIVIQAAKHYGVPGVGIEIDQELVQRARANAVREKVGHLVEFRHQDAFDADISGATVVTLYMLPDFNARFRAVMERQLRPGTRVVTHDYPIAGWAPDRVESYREESGREHMVMLFTVR